MNRALGKARSTLSRKNDDLREDYGDPFEDLVDEDFIDPDDDHAPDPELDPGGTAEKINRLLEGGAITDTRVLRELMAIESQAVEDERNLNDARDSLSRMQESYRRLTKPANRLATYLGPLSDKTALISVSDAEFLAEVDPAVALDQLPIGSRVRINEAYAILGPVCPPVSGLVVRVADVLENGQLRVGGDQQGNGGRVLIRAGKLVDAQVRRGDEVTMDPTMRVALEHFPAQETKDYFLEQIPEIPWSAVGGQEDAIRLIRETIETPLIHPELYERFNKKPLRGILLFGPPGCGKTLIGKATAYNLTREYNRRMNKDMKEYFMYINGPKILNMWLGETERMVREIFATAREKAAEGHLVFIFVDEAESILRTRTSGKYFNISNTVVPQFATEMDGLIGLQNVVVMLTSNRPDYIDPAILRPERIDRKIKIKRPDRQAARDILAIYLKDMPLDPALVQANGSNPESAREAVVDDTLGFIFRRVPETRFLEVFFRNGSSEILHWRDLLSGALLMSVVERAKDDAIRRAIDTGDENVGISMGDLESAVRTEFKENEIFPKSDTQEDWLKLLDYEPENVVNVQPIRADADNRGARGHVI